MSSKVAPADSPGETFTPAAYATPFSAERARGIAANHMTLADGRKLEYFTDGDPSKPAVFLIHGQWCRGNVWIGPPRTDVFLVCPTRPNYGGSTRHKDYSYASFADDVRQLADHLKISSFHVLGASSGGPCALAIKATLKARVGKCVLISSDTEHATMHGGKGHGSELMCCGPGKCCSCCLPCCMDKCFAPMMAAQMKPEKMWAMVEKGDHKSMGIKPIELDGWKLLGKEKSDYATEVIREVFASGGTGGTADYRLEAKRWAGAYVEHLSELDDVELWHGDSDATVPFAAALHLQGKVPKATLHKLAGWGHELGNFLLESQLDALAAAPLTMER